MVDEVKAQLEARKQVLNQEFEQAKVRLSALSKEQAQLQNKLVHLQGAYQEVESLLNPPQPVPEDK